MMAVHQRKPSNDLNLLMISRRKSASLRSSSGLTGANREKKRPGRRSRITQVPDSSTEPSARSLTLLQILEGWNGSAEEATRLTEAAGIRLKRELLQLSFSSQTVGGPPRHRFAFSYWAKAGNRAVSFDEQLADFPLAKGECDHHEMDRAGHCLNSDRHS